MTISICTEGFEINLVEASSYIGAGGKIFLKNPAGVRYKENLDEICKKIYFEVLELSSSLGVSEPYVGMFKNQVTIIDNIYTRHQVQRDAETYEQAKFFEKIQLSVSKLFKKEDKKDEYFNFLIHLSNQWSNYEFYTPGTPWVKFKLEMFGPASSYTVDLSSNLSVPVKTKLMVLDYMLPTINMNVQHLLEDIGMNICSKLPIGDVVNLKKVSKSWYNFTKVYLEEDFYKHATICVNLLKTQQAFPQSLIPQMESMLKNRTKKVPNILKRCFQAWATYAFMLKLQQKIAEAPTRSQFPTLNQFSKLPLIPTGSFIDFAKACNYWFLMNRQSITQFVYSSDAISKELDFRNCAFFSAPKILNHCPWLTKLDIRYNPLVHNPNLSNCSCLESYNDYSACSSEWTSLSPKVQLYVPYSPDYDYPSAGDYS